MKHTQFVLYLSIDSYTIITRNSLNVKSCIDLFSTFLFYRTKTGGLFLFWFFLICHYVTRMLV